MKHYRGEPFAGKTYEVSWLGHKIFFVSSKYCGKYRGLEEGTLFLSQHCKLKHEDDG